jgi:NAD(P)-dependent dehydrogenase (short-subunit alcohol dehydrogenase family)
LMTDTLGGCHALITGGGSGIGAEIARTLDREGAAVTVIGRHVGPLEEVAKSLRSSKAIVADVTSEADCSAMVKAARDSFGPIDILIANAGTADSARFDKINRRHWDRILGVNLTGAFLSAHAALADLTRRSSTPAAIRRLIFIASTAGLKGYAYTAPYCAAKHGVVGLSRALATEFAGTTLTVNAVCPGFTETPLLAAAISNIVDKTGRSPQDVRAALVRTNPQARFIKPSEVAAAVRYLCSPAAASITGQALSVSGGEI